MIQKRYLLPIAAIFLGVSMLGGSLRAEEKPAAKPKEEMKLDALEISLVIKSTIIALHQANLTGNYSVLRDLGTPVFRERFNQAKLTEIFANLRARQVNLTPVMVLSPTLAKQPELVAPGQILLEGAFPTQPLQVQFKMIVQPIDGVWRIEGLAVDAVPVQAMANAGNTAAAANPPSAEQKAAENKADKKKGKSEKPEKKN